MVKGTLKARSLDVTITLYDITINNKQKKRSKRKMIDIEEGQKKEEGKK